MSKKKTYAIVLPLGIIVCIAILFFAFKQYELSRILLLIYVLAVGIILLRQTGKKSVLCLLTAFILLIVIDQIHFDSVAPNDHYLGAYQNSLVSETDSQFSGAMFSLKDDKTYVLSNISIDGYQVIIGNYKEVNNGFLLDCDLLEDPLFLSDGHTGYLIVSGNEIVQMTKKADYSVDTRSSDSRVLDYTR